MKNQFDVNARISNGTATLSEEASYVIFRASRMDSAMFSYSDFGRRSARLFYLKSNGKTASQRVKVAIFQELLSKGFLTQEGCISSLYRPINVVCCGQCEVAIAKDAGYCDTCEWHEVRRGHFVSRLSGYTIVKSSDLSGYNVVNSEDKVVDYFGTLEAARKYYARIVRKSMEEVRVVIADLEQEAEVEAVKEAFDAMTTEEVVAASDALMASIPDSVKTAADLEEYNAKPIAGSASPSTQTQEVEAEEVAYTIYLNRQEDEQGRLTCSTDGFKDGDRMENVYSGTIPQPFNGFSFSDSSVWEILDTIYERFNIDHPLNYRQRSLSVGDVVSLTFEGDERFYEVSPMGFSEVFDVRACAGIKDSDSLAARMHRRQCLKCESKADKGGFYCVPCEQAEQAIQANFNASIDAQASIAAKQETTGGDSLHARLEADRLDTQAKDEARKYDAYVDSFSDIRADYLQRRLDQVFYMIGRLQSVVAAKPIEEEVNKVIQAFWTEDTRMAKECSAAVIAFLTARQDALTEDSPRHVFSGN